MRSSLSLSCKANSLQPEIDEGRIDIKGTVSPLRNIFGNSSGHSFASYGMDFNDKDPSISRIASRDEGLGYPTTVHAEMAQPIIRGIQYEQGKELVERFQHLHYSSQILEELYRGQLFCDMDQHFQRQKEEQRRQLLLCLHPHSFIDEAARIHGPDNLLLCGDSFVPAGQLVQHHSVLSTLPERGAFSESRSIPLSWRLQSIHPTNRSLSLISDIAGSAEAAPATQRKTKTVSENAYQGVLPGRNHNVSISAGYCPTTKVSHPTCSQGSRSKKKSRVNLASPASTPSQPWIGGNLGGLVAHPRIHDYSAGVGTKDEPFPLKLHAILTHPDYHDIIGWYPHGKSWKVYQATLFEKIVSPRFFRQTKFASFMRQGKMKNGITMISFAQQLDQLLIIYICFVALVAPYLI